MKYLFISFAFCQYRPVRAATTTHEWRHGLVLNSTQYSFTPCCCFTPKVNCCEAVVVHLPTSAVKKAPNQREHVHNGTNLTDGRHQHCCDLGVAPVSGVATVALWATLLFGLSAVGSKESQRAAVLVRFPAPFAIPQEAWQDQCLMCWDHWQRLSCRGTHPCSSHPVAGTL